MAGRPTVRTTAGRVTGRETGGYRVFHGIPFAAPPVGVLRWRSPRPPAEWRGTVDATTPAPGPAQVAAPWLPGFETSEDCLRLSVWAPMPGGDEPLPVLLWVYGGGFEGGTAVSPVSDPSRFVVEQRVVVVAANHRVGALGFAQLDHRGPRFAETTNLGLQDVLAALEWASANASAFGGDPDRITVMGHSSGAFLSAALAAVPTARSLFRRLALFSGGASRLVPPDAARALADRVLEALAGQLGTADLEALADASVSAIVRAQQSGPARDIGRRNEPSPDAFGVVLDGAVVTQHPLAAVESGLLQGVDVLVGTTSEEIAGLRGPGPFAPGGFSGIETEVASWGLDAATAHRVVDHYRTERDADSNREALLTDYVYRLPAARLAHTHTVAGGRTWLMEFGPCPSVGPRAPHGMETPLLLGSHLDPAVARIAGYPPGRQHARERLSTALRERLGSFVRAGDPGWERTDTTGGGPALVVADDEITIRRERYAETLRVWEGIGRP